MPARVCRVPIGLAQDDRCSSRMRMSGQDSAPSRIPVGLRTMVHAPRDFRLLVGLLAQRLPVGVGCTDHATEVESIVRASGRSTDRRRSNVVSAPIAPKVACDTKQWIHSLRHLFLDEQYSVVGTSYSPLPHCIREGHAGGPQPCLNAHLSPCDSLAASRTTGCSLLPPRTWLHPVSRG